MLPGPAIVQQKHISSMFSFFSSFLRHQGEEFVDATGDENCY
jgi:hypothetical protein